MSNRRQFQISNAIINYQPNINENHHRAKLTNDSVLYIKSQLAIGATTKDLAKEFNVDPGAIRSIKRGDTWKNIA